MPRVTLEQSIKISKSGYLEKENYKALVDAFGIDIAEFIHNDPEIKITKEVKELCYEALQDADITDEEYNDIVQRSVDIAITAYNKGNADSATKQQFIDTCLGLWQYSFVLDIIDLLECLGNSIYYRLEEYGVNNKK